MKKLILAVSLLVLFGFNSNAQDEKKIVLGFQGHSGFSFFSPESEGYESNGAVFSKGFGLRVDYAFAKNYHFSTGFNANYLGGKLKYDHLKDVNGNGTFFTGSLERKYSINYLDIPLNLVLKTNEIGYFTYFLQTGINASLRMKTKMEDKFIYDDLNGDQQININDGDAKENIKFFNSSYNVGIGAEYSLGKSFSAYGMLFFETGLINVLDGTNTVDNTIEEYAKLKNIGLRIGILF